MSIYEDVTARIVAELERGALPWIKPWGAAGADRNLVSKKEYSGINRMLLGMSGRSSSTWATFKQWKEAGCSVRKGEKGEHIVYFSKVAKLEESESGEDAKIKAYAMLKQYVVFSGDQVDGFAEPVTAEHPAFVAHDECERVIQHSGASITHGGNQAFYARSLDMIKLPHKADFSTPESYYATAFHELIHWTGSVKRLDRNLSKGRFGNPAYAFEELVAEIGAAYLCADHGIAGDLRHAGYIDSWLKALRSDSRAIFKAAALAQQGAAFINAAADAVPADPDAADLFALAA